MKIICLLLISCICNTLLRAQDEAILYCGADELRIEFLKKIQ